MELQWNCYQILNTVYIHFIPNSRLAKIIDFAIKLTPGELIGYYNQLIPSMILDLVD